MSAVVGTPRCGVRKFFLSDETLFTRRRTVQRAVPTMVGAAILLLAGSSLLAQADPASEPAVLAVAKVLPAVVNINTERVVRRRVRDPFEDFAAQYFGIIGAARARSGRRCKASARDSLSIPRATS